MIRPLSLGLVALTFCAIASRQAAADCNPNASTASLASTDFVSPRHAYAQLRCLEKHFVSRGDRRAIFASMYALTTLRVAESIEAGAYRDDEWVFDYLVRFANAYREALYDYERGARREVPGAWLIAFDSARSGSNLILQDALLGMNAHITYDLAHVLYDVGIDPSRSDKYRDHDDVNLVLFEILDEIEDLLADVYAPALARFDLAVGQLDEVLGRTAIGLARAQAWRAAIQLTDAWFGFQRQAVSSYLSVQSQAAAALIRSPVLVPGLGSSLRALEGSNPLSTFCARFACAR